MTLVLLSIWWVGRQYIYDVDSIRSLSLIFHWWFHCLQRLSFRWRFMNQLWHRVLDNSMRQPWLYICYRLEASFMNSETLSILYVGCHSVFIVDLKFYKDVVLTDDLWINNDIAFLTIPCVSHDSIFAIDLMRWSRIHWCYLFHASAVT
jgi:hypothetical protein